MVSPPANSSYGGGSHSKTIKFADSSLEGVLECVLSGGKCFTLWCHLLFFLVGEFVMSFSQILDLSLGS